MKKFFEQLRPLEQRIVIATGVIVFILANWVWVWPHFSDWSKARASLEDTKSTIVRFNKQIAERNQWDSEKKKLEGEGSVLPSEEMALQLRRFVDEQAALSGVIENGVTLSSSTANRGSDKSTGVFEERNLTMGYIAGDAELVDFLYNLGAGKSTIRVRDLSIKPDPGLMKLQGNMTLVATYQKKTPSTAAPGAKPAAPAVKPNTSTPGAAGPKTPPTTPPGPATNSRVPPREFKSKM